jgi:hypothetical protein
MHAKEKRSLANPAAPGACLVSHGLLVTPYLLLAVSANSSAVNAAASCTLFQYCAVQGPTPETRSTRMWVMNPGGGLAMGGNRTPGPR